MTRGRQNQRRLNGEGSVYWREDRQRWVAEFVTGWGTAARKRTTKSFKTQQEASKHLIKLRQDADQGLRLDTRNMRMNKWLDYWMTQVEASKRKPSTKSSYRENVKLHAKPALGYINVIELRPEHVHNYLMDLRSRQYSQSMLKISRTVLALALDQAVLEDRVLRNVARAVPLPTALKPPRKILAWSLPEAQRFLAEAKSHRLYASFVLLCMVGLRKGEVLGLHWEDFDPVEKTLRVDRQVQRVKGIKGLLVEAPKSAKSRRLIHLPMQAVNVLQEHRRRQEVEREKAFRWKDERLMFTTEIGTHFDPRNFNEAVTDICRKAKIEASFQNARTPHSLRHTAATTARALGVDWKEIQAMLGHSSIKITMDLYVDDVPELQRSSAEMIDSGFQLPKNQLPSKSPSAEEKNKSTQNKEEPPEAHNA